MENLKILTTKASKDYELLDSGDGEKLERFGEYVLRRPDPQALWGKSLEEKVWKEADASFLRPIPGRASTNESGKWKKKENVANEWFIEMLKDEKNKTGLK